MNRFMGRLAAIVGLMVSCLVAVAGESVYFCLPGEGTASLHFSKADQTAYLVDGGKRGRQGIAVMEMDGKAVLTWLRERGVEHLIIACSHPHSDHLDGLVTLITTSPEMAEFSSVGFVDSGFDKSQRLYEEYTRACKEKNWDVKKQRVEWASAEAADGYAAIRERLGLPNATADEERVVASSFTYEHDLGAKPHGNCIITTLKSEGADGVQTIVDFDDADSKLVAKWASATGDPARADVLIMPHHGSALTDVGPLLDQKLLSQRSRPPQCIFTANSGNRFEHPGPRTLAAAIRAVGLDNVFITGEGDHITVTEKGVVAHARDWDSFRDEFVQPHYDRLDAEIRELLGRRSLSPAEQATLNKRQEQKKDAEYVLREINNKNKRRSPEAVIPSTRGTPRPPTHPNRPGPDIDPGPGRDPGVPPSGSPGDPSVGPFKERVIEPIWARQSGIVTPGLERIEMRAAKFRVSKGGVPVEGGIIVGAKVTGPDGPISSARFVKISAGVDLEVTVGTGAASTKARLSGYSATMLAAAYRFVSPTDVDRATYGVEDGDCSLLSMASNDGASWTFALHPAIAGTVVGRDGMKLDMAPSAIPELTPSQHYSTYQWFDAPSRITLRGGVIDVAPAEGPPETMLRIRLWLEPEWATGDDLICPPGTSPASGLVFGGKDAFKGLEDGRHRQAVHGGTDREQAA